MDQITNINEDAKQFLINYGKRIRIKRKKAKLTLVKLAILIGSDISRLSRIERGLLNITINEIYTLDSDLDIILYKTDPMDDVNNKKK